MAGTIFYNAQIVTMDDTNPLAQAVLIEEDKIRKVGTNEEVLAYKQVDTTLRDLTGYAVLPGFIDPHSHFTAVAYDLLMVNAKPSPAGPCDTRELLLEEFRKAYQSGNWSDGDWLMGMGYDPSAFPDKAGITRLELDRISTKIPICCIHSSGHMVILNTLGLKILGYWGAYTVPSGGTVELLPDGTPSGMITELAYLSPQIQSKIKAPGFESVLESLKRTSELYASFGVTTAQDARVNLREYQLLTEGGKSGAIAIDVVGIVAPRCRRAAACERTKDRPLHRSYPNGRLQDIPGRISAREDRLVIQALSYSPGGI